MCFILLAEVKTFGIVNARLQDLRCNGLQVNAAPYNAAMRFSCAENVARLVMQGASKRIVDIRAAMQVR